MTYGSWVKRGLTQKKTHFKVNEFKVFIIIKTKSNSNKLMKLKLGANIVYGPFHSDGWDIVLPKLTMFCIRVIHGAARLISCCRDDKFRQRQF